MSTDDDAVRLALEIQSVIGDLPAVVVMKACLALATRSAVQCRSSRALFLENAGTLFDMAKERE